MEGRQKKAYISRTVALSKLQRYCAYQDRCHQEVRSKLLDLGVYGDELEEIMAQLITDRFLDEERFARSFARGKFLVKQWGRIRITAELRLRKISDYCVRAALSEIDEQRYREQLQQLLTRKAALEQLSAADISHRQRLFQFALRKGYEPELVQQALAGWQKA